MMRFRMMVWLAVVASPLLGCLEEETPAGDSGLTADGGPAPDGGPPPDVGAPPDEGVIAECTTTSAPITSLITTLEIPSVAKGERTKYSLVMTLGIRMMGRKAVTLDNMVATLRSSWIGFFAP